ncbi:MAG: hypothetical protein KJ621_14520 [Proteobacteria bacterium]|nr:hypothetical protein [Pseudomonadota bacterium]MBU1742890.1 hypothetical protein [Pseudomonadota bacterium]
MALDEPRDDDQSFDLNGINTIVNSDLLTRAEEINIDFVEAGFRSGFSITTKAPVITGDPSGCGTSCSC